MTQTATQPRNAKGSPLAGAWRVDNQRGGAAVLADPIGAFDTDDWQKRAAYGSYTPLTDIVPGESIGEQASRVNVLREKHSEQLVAWFDAQVKRQFGEHARTVFRFDDTGQIALLDIETPDDPADPDGSYSTALGGSADQSLHEDASLLNSTYALGGKEMPGYDSNYDGTFQLQPHVPFSQKKLNDTRDAIARHCVDLGHRIRHEDWCDIYDAGYPHARIEMAPSKDPDSCAEPFVQAVIDRDGTVLYEVGGNSENTVSDEVGRAIDSINHRFDTAYNGHRFEMGVAKLDEIVFNAEVNGSAEIPSRLDPLDLMDVDYSRDIYAGASPLF